MAKRAWDAVIANEAVLADTPVMLLPSPWNEPENEPVNDIGLISCFPCILAIY